MLQKPLALERELAQKHNTIERDGHTTSKQYTPPQAKFARGIKKLTSTS